MRRLAVLPKSAETPAADAARQTVLVVDDDESMRTLLRRVLERTGFTVITATNGQDGMERFAEQPVDIVVTDMMMPVLDGVELIRALRGKCPDVRIVAISGVEYPYLRMALGYGAKATLRKPVESARLVETLHRVLAAA
jgi:two-component system cell cycle sensor histidine kinase/response regulator CckA